MQRNDLYHQSLLILALRALIIPSIACLLSSRYLMLSVVLVEAVGWSPGARRGRVTALECVESAQTGRTIWRRDACCHNVISA